MKKDLQWTVPDQFKNPETLKTYLNNFKEIRFISLVGIDFLGNDTDERIPVDYFIKNMTDIFSGGVQTDGSSVNLPGIATLNDAKIDFVIDTGSKWFVDHNFDNLTAEGKPVATVRIPIFFKHHNKLCCSRSVLKNTMNHVRKELIAIITANKDLLPEPARYSEIKDIEFTLGTELEFWVRSAVDKVPARDLEVSQMLKESYWKRTKGQVRTCLEEALETLVLYGFEPEMGHKEVGGIKGKISADGRLFDVMEQLEGQIASAKIAMARLASAQLYYVLSGNDFTLDINNPLEPKILCAGNNPQKLQTYGAVLSLYSNRLVKLVNQKDKLKCGIIKDEFPTEYVTGIDSLIATARGNKVVTCLGLQDFTQLRKDYGREQADVITNIVGNIICGQVTGDTAKQLSERFGKIMQDRVSYSINSGDTSISRSKQLESAVPPSIISSLSSGEFVGMVADNPDCKIDLKAFHCQIINDHKAIAQEESQYQPIPEIRKVDAAMVQRNYLQIKQDVEDIIHAEMQRLQNDPSLRHLVIKK